MLQIAVCDDDPAQLSQITQLVQAFAQEKHLDVQVTSFAHPDALEEASISQIFHIYLLDMVMPMLSGLELGCCIRRRDADAQIIYITTEPGFALDAYAVNPLHYLLKPVQREQLFFALELAAKKADYGRMIAVTVHTKDGLRTLTADEVVSCEYVCHRAVYVLWGGERVETTTLRISFAEHIAPLLHDGHFLQPHAAFVVNMRYVERLDHAGFTMRGGTFVPVSGRQYAAVREAYLKYRLGEGV